jgi:signal transduction histidine kinase
VATRKRILVLQRTTTPEASAPIDAVSELQAKLAFLETLNAAFDELRDEESTARIIGRLATRELADSCWVFIGAAKNELHLAFASGSDVTKGRPEMPPHLPRRVARLGRSLRKEVRQAGDETSCILLPMQVEKGLLGVIALVLRQPAGPSAAWMAEHLATQAAHALDRARAWARVHRAVRIRDDAFAAAAHELGNSLAAMGLQVHAILQAVLTQTLDFRFLSRLYAMERQVARLIELNHRMLASSRRTTAAFEPRLEPVDLSETVREVLSREADQLAWRRCRIELTSPGPVIGRWDKGLLDQIFSNLLSNAMKYGHGKPISIALHATPGKARLRVRDQGIGIADDDQARIFEKFERAAAVEKGSSLGLGLWLVREMVHALGGTVRLQSAIGGGSTFEVELPRSPTARPGEGKRSETH